MKVGVVGIGAIAHPHLNAYSLNEYVEEIHIADVDETALSEAQRRYPKIKGVFRDYEELIEKTDVQVIDICTPHYLHHPIAIQALRAGKDVICEKPIAMSLEEADEMINTAKETGRRLFVSMNQRFMPYHKKANKLIEEGSSENLSLLCST